MANQPEPEVRAKVVSKRNNKFGKKGRKFRDRDPYAPAVGGGEGGLDF